jgi:hypothetical protein
MRLGSFIWIWFFLAGCASASPPSPPVTPVENAAPNPSAPMKIAPRPFTAEEIRQAMPVGHELRYRMEVEGKPTTIDHWVVTAADEAKMTISSKAYAEDGKLVEDQGSETSAWTALMEHATFPADKTTLREVDVDVPAGKFPGVLYEVRDKDKDGVEVVSRFHFARTKPGPPMLVTIEREGKMMRKMILLERK